MGPLAQYDAEVVRDPPGRPPWRSPGGDPELDGASGNLQEELESVAGKRDRHGDLNHLTQQKLIAS